MNTTPSSGPKCELVQAGTDSGDIPQLSRASDVLQFVTFPARGAVAIQSHPSISSRSETSAICPQTRPETRSRHVTSVTSSICSWNCDTRTSTFLSTTRRCTRSRGIVFTTNTTSLATSRGEPCSATMTEILRQTNLSYDCQQWSMRSFSKRLEPTCEITYWMNTTRLETERDNYAHKLARENNMWCQDEGGYCAEMPTSTSLDTCLL